MSQGDGIDDVSELISCKNRSPELAVPQVDRITDVREFLSSPENHNVDIMDIKDRLSAKTQQCRNVLKLLNGKLQLKLSTLEKVKKDMLALTVDMKDPAATLRFVTKREKIKLHYLDEPESKECEIYEALEWLNLKMGSLYCEIVGLDSDVDYVTYLKRIAKLNTQALMEFYQKEIKEQPENSTV